MCLYLCVNTCVTCFFFDTNRVPLVAICLFYMVFTGLLFTGPVFTGPVFTGLASTAQPYWIRLPGLAPWNRPALVLM